MNTTIGGYELVRTCTACPEQYDVLYNGEKVAYLRLRHGFFYASVPGVGGEVVYKSHTDGDGLFTDEERPLHLISAIHAIHSHRVLAQ